MRYSLLSYTIGFTLDKFVKAQANAMFMEGRAKPCLVGLGILSDFQFMMRLSGYEVISSEEAPTINTHNTPLKQGHQNNGIITLLLSSKSCHSDGFTSSLFSLKYLN